MKNRDFLQSGIHDLERITSQINMATQALPVTTANLPLLNELRSQTHPNNGAIADEIRHGTAGPNDAPGNDKHASTSFPRAVLVAVLSYVAAALLFSLMALGCADVVGRYFLGKPITGGLEVTELLLAAMIFVGLPMVSIEQAHVGLEILDSIAPPWLTRVLHWFSNIISGGALMYLSWMLLQRAENLYYAKETTAILQLPLYPAAYLMSACVALAALITFAIAWLPAPQHEKAQTEFEND